MYMLVGFDNSHVYKLVHLAKVAYTNLSMEMKYYWVTNTDSPPLSVLFPRISFCIDLIPLLIINLQV